MQVVKTTMSFISILTSQDSEEIEFPLPKALWTQYSPSFEAFDAWAKNHRQHQTEAIEAIRNNQSGQISMPTATGKTRVQIHAHVEQLINNTKNGKFGVHVIASHRLALNHQLLNELLNVIVNSGIPFDTLFIGTDRFADDQIHARFRNKGLNKYNNESTSTTRGEEVLTAYNKAISRNRHLIVVSTYHSFDRLKVIPQIEMCTYDEAHTLVGESFLENIKEVLPKISRNYFFTATRKVRGLVGGMNNEEIFGKIIYETSPRHMIDVSEIVPPRLHIIDTVDEGDYSNHTMIVKAVITGVNQHRYLIKQYSSTPDSIGAKLLVTTTGNKELMELHADPLFQQYCRDEGIQTFAYSSEYGAFHNFENKDRQAAVAAMQGLNDSSDAIIMHIDILTEGIDLPSITGVMPFRELNSVKLLQTIGRSARLLKDDRVALYSGNILPKQYENFIKPYCWLVVPRFFKSLGDFNTMKNTLKNIINSYEIPVEEYTILDRFKAIKEGSVGRITERDKCGKDKETDLVYVIEDIINEKVSEMNSIDIPIQSLGSYFKIKAKEIENA